MSVLARSPMARTVLVAAATLSLAAGTAASAAAAPVPATHGVRAAAHDYRRACALTRRPGIAACMVLVRTDVKQHAAAYFHSNAPVGFGYGRPTLKSAYNLPSSSPVRNVAVVDAYNDPNAVSDLAVYRSSWGLPACNTTTGAGCLTVTNENGAASPLPANSGTTGWATEESLDVDMVSAICPKCHIFLVEANSPSISDLGTGVDSAVSVLGAGYVSNSYGAGESSFETSYDTSYYQHAGVAVTASAGDSGYGVEYPAASQYVTAVGGTTLRRNSGTSRGWTETVWGSAARRGHRLGLLAVRAKSRPGRPTRDAATGSTTMSPRSPTPAPAWPSTTPTTRAAGSRSAGPAWPHRSSPRSSRWPARQRRARTRRPTRTPTPAR